MKKLTFVLIIGLLPVTTYAARTDPSACEYETLITTPAGYCCISFRDDNGHYAEKFWNCDNLSLIESSIADCKSERSNCIDYCYSYDLDNDTCWDSHCNGWKVVNNPIDAEDCTIPNAETCEYREVCDKCDNNCHREDEEVSTCIDRYYNTEDWKQCLKCPGNGMVDYDAGNIGIAQCYIPRTPPLTGSDETGTFQYVNDKCHYKE